jgi:hypothetical protein
MDSKANRELDLADPGLELSLCLYVQTHRRQDSFTAVFTMRSAKLTAPFP